jgi:hypothetical protein
MAQTTAEAHNYQTKKLNSKTQYTTSTDQHKSTKKRVSTKPIFLSILRKMFHFRLFHCNKI